MARFNKAEWLGEHSPEWAMVRYDIVCVHTIVGFAPAHAAHFSTHHDGRMQQSRDTRYRSGANLDGNHRVISVENEDHGPGFPNWSGSNVPKLTDKQVTANAEILAWAHKTHGVPLQLCPNSKPTSRGLAYHRQGCNGNFGSFDFPGRVSGGEEWSTAFGKVCPGDKRIAQLPEILRQAKIIVSGEDDMPLTDADIAKIATAVKDRTLEALANETGELAVRARQQIAKEVLFRVRAPLHLNKPPPVISDEPEQVNLLTSSARGAQHTVQLANRLAEVAAPEE